MFLDAITLCSSAVLGIFLGSQLVEAVLFLFWSSLVDRWQLEKVTTKHDLASSKRADAILTTHVLQSTTTLAAKTSNGPKERVDGAENFRMNHRDLVNDESVEASHSPSHTAVVWSLRIDRLLDDLSVILKT